MRFAYPNVLWLLLVLPPALAVFFWWAMRRKQELMAQFIQTRLLPGLTVGISPGRQQFRFSCIVLAIALLIVVLARPQWGYHYEEVKQRGLDIAVAIDTSKSMLAEDIAPNRLQRAKLAALDLMQQAKSDRLGLIAFAGGAFLQCPLTIDDTAFRQSVESLDVTTIPQGGTALAEAIHTALEAFKERDNYKVLVIFTDGEDNDEGALAAAEAAAKEGLRIYAVGIGTAEGELLRISDNKGRTDYVRDEQGNVVKSHLNEALLQQIAAATEGGVYLRLAGAKTVDTLYEKFLSTLPKSEQTARLVRQYHEQFHWPLAAAILLLLVEMLLPEATRERKSVGNIRHKPTHPPPLQGGEQDSGRSTAVPLLGGVRGGFSGTMIVALALALPRTVLGSSSTALRDYNSGKYDKALKEYQRVLQRRTNDARLQFNAGDAAYRNEKYDEAARQFARATSAQALNVQQRAYYNLGNTLYRTGESENDSDKKKEMWESSLKQYDGAIKLNTNDADAKFNYEFVKKKLEELKKQEQKQDDKKKDQQQDQKQDQDKNQQDQQQDKQDQGKKDQAKNDQQDQQKQDSKQKQNQQQSQQKKDEQQKEQAKNQSDQQKEQEKKEQQQAKSGADKEKKRPDEQPEQQQAEARGVRPMTPQEAQQLLDAQKGDDKLLQFKPAEQQKNSDRPIKDW